MGSKMAVEMGRATKKPDKTGARPDNVDAKDTMVPAITALIRNSIESLLKNRQVTPGQSHSQAMESPII